MRCLVCNGDDEHCSECGGSGQTAITSCPKQMVTPDIWRAMELYGFATKGAWPMAGGTLDQAAAFLDFYRTVENQEAQHKARLKISDG